jgi:hypothetical protein
VSPPEPNIKVVADGGNDEFDQTFSHPVHGELTFKAKLPTSVQLLAHRVAMDNYLAGLVGEPSRATFMLAASIAGLQTIMELPVVKEGREVLDEESGHEQVTKIRYDPAAEVDDNFPVMVWGAFSEWRVGFLDQLGDLKNSSGETRGLDSSESSTAPTGSPSTTPA